MSRLRYIPSALNGWHDWVPARNDDIFEEGDDIDPNTIFGHDLVLINGKDRYLLFSTNDYDEALELVFAKYRSDKPTKRRNLYEYMTADEVHFEKDEMRLIMPEKTEVFPIEAFHWKERSECGGRCGTCEVNSPTPPITSGNKVQDAAEVNETEKEKEVTGEKEAVEAVGTVGAVVTKQGRGHEQNNKTDGAESDSSIGSVIICN